MPEVSIAACADYQPQTCRRALEQALSAIDALDWVKPGMRVAVKANLVAAMKPSAAATTHPALLCALTALLRERGASVVIGDSPGGLYNAAFLNHVYAATGMHEVEAAGAALNQDFSQKEAHYPQAVTAKTFLYTGWLDGADAIIDFCKLKSHGMMGMSAAVKNMFGVIPGTLKPEYHFRFPDTGEFAQMILDLDEYFKPVLSIADAVVTMEGNGPTMGTPRQLGAVLASKSPHKLDLVCASLIGVKREQVPTLQVAFERGLIPQSADELSVAGEPERFFLPDFHRLDTKNSLQFRNELNGPLGTLWGGIVKTCMCSRPGVDAHACIGCAKCEKICPASAIKMVHGVPKIDRIRCIRCFCCQEFCPKGAMQVTRPFVAKLLNPTK